MAEKLPEYTSFSAGATRTKLKVFADEERPYYGQSCRLFAKRAKVGKHTGPKHAFVFVNESCAAEEADVAIILQKGYDFAKHGAVEPLVWAISSATCESGVLMVVPFGFEYSVSGYKNRTPPRYYRVTRAGNVDITAEVAASKQEPI